MQNDIFVCVPGVKNVTLRPVGLRFQLKHCFGYLETVFLTHSDNPLLPFSENATLVFQFIMQSSRRFIQYKLFISVCFVIILMQVINKLNSGATVENLVFDGLQISAALSRKNKTAFLKNHINR